MNRRSRRLAAVGLGLLGAACGGDDIEFYGAFEESPGRLVVELRVCTPEVTADVIETDREIRIDEVAVSEVLHGDDCNGGLTVELDRPLGTRALIVEEQRWVPFDGTCERQWTLVPPDLPGRFVDCPG